MRGANPARTIWWKTGTNRTRNRRVPLCDAVSPVVRILLRPFPPTRTVEARRQRTLAVRIDLASHGFGLPHFPLFRRTHRKLGAFRSLLSHGNALAAGIVIQ